jgi:hypothetical protein
LSTLRSDGLTAVGLAIDLAHGFRVAEVVAIGPVADVGIHRSDDLIVSSWMGGGRLTIGRPAVRAFGQFLVGFERCCGVSDLAWQPGGGLDVRVTDRLNLRGQLDVRVVRIDAGGIVFRSRDARLTVGASLPF